MILSTIAGAFEEIALEVCPQPEAHDIAAEVVDNTGKLIHLLGC